MEKGMTLIQHLMVEINNSIKEDETIFYDILKETDLDVLELAELLSDKNINLESFVLVHGTYKNILKAREDKTLEKGKTI